MEAISASLQNPNRIPKISHSSGLLSATTVEIPNPASVSVEEVRLNLQRKEAKRRKWLEDNPETTTNGRAAVIGFFVAYTFVPVMNPDFFRIEI
ncbi:unnamed protein product [Brassica napus]|uniref:(rape) hypothetical protein n=1 Tax=Brassica napus TaxID=3708 RepID=A0A816Q2C2_BRANA|nr:unnamed protein product [Brassica napus]